MEVNRGGKNNTLYTVSFILSHYGSLCSLTLLHPHYKHFNSYEYAGFSHFSFTAIPLYNSVSLQLHTTILFFTFTILIFIFCGQYL